MHRGIAWEKDKAPASWSTGLEMDPLRLLSLRPHPSSINSISETLASPGSPWHGPVATPESGHRSTRRMCPLRANSDLTRRSKKHRYSITSSASANIFAEKAQPWGRTWHELRLLLVPVQSGKGTHPRQRRAEPVLPAWDEITALAQDSHPYHVGRLLPLPRRCRIDR